MSDARADDKPDGPLLVDQLRFMARRFPDSAGYVDLDSGSTLTFREWDEKSNQAARWLVANGVIKGDRVKLWMERGALPTDRVERLLKKEGILPSEAAEPVASA